MNRRNIVTSWEDVPVVIDLPFASRIVGSTPESLKKRAQNGQFPAYKEGKLWRVDKEALRRYIAEKTIMYMDTSKEAYAP